LKPTGFTMCAFVHLSLSHILRESPRPRQSSGLYEEV